MSFQHDFDLLLVDIDIDVDKRIEFCKMLRFYYECPLLILSCDSTSNRILYLYDMGCDDYIIKPVDFNILLAKINVFLKLDRRKTDLLKKGSAILDLNHHIFQDEDINVILTPIEFQILYLIMVNANSIITRQQFLAQIWDHKGREVNNETLTTHISILKKKIESNSRTYILTLRGVGYQWNPDFLNDD